MRSHFSIARTRNGMPFKINASNRINHRLRLFALCVAWLSVPLLSSAASFPCEKASTEVERTICKDKELSDLDEYLGRYYSAARAELRHANVCLATDQKAWLGGVRDACKDAACLKKSYLLSELDGLQPGATALKNVQLPRTPTLVGILPPAADQVAAPRSANLKPLSVQGTLVDEVSTGDGYLIVSREGRRHLLAVLMLLDDSTRVLETLSHQAATTYLIRGHAEPGANKPEVFAQSTCRYIYRVPQ